MRTNILISVFVLFSSGISNAQHYMKEKYITTSNYGHTLNATQVFSPDDNWIYYDTRNDDTHISRTGSVEKVNINTGKIILIYKTTGQTLYGPGVGAVSCHPAKNDIIFIHGLLNSDEKQPYGFTRRFGAIVREGQHAFEHADARSISTPVAGALRGGTHAHTWSGDGEWISFTYNDYLIEQLEKKTSGKIKDLRTIGVMSPLKEISVRKNDSENFSGLYFTVVAATVVDNPKPGSDDIDRAFDECWIGLNGYIKKDGSRQKRAIAFQGNVRDDGNHVITEVFIAELPEDVTKETPSQPIAGTLESRPNVPAGISQRRITFTSQRTFPGIQGPRFRLRTSPDGSQIYFLAKDEKGTVQIFAIPTAGGDIVQKSSLEYAVNAQFNVSPDGKWFSAVADNSVWLIEINTGKSTRLTEKTSDDTAPVGGAIWNHKGDMLAYNRYVGTGNDRYLQIVTLGISR